MQDATVDAVNSIPTDGPMLDRTRANLRRACDQLSIHPDVFEELQWPRETLAVTLLIRMDDGT